MWILLAASLACVTTASSALAQIVNPDLWSTDGNVHAIATSGNTVYIGGQFSHVRTHTGSFARLATTGELREPNSLTVEGGSVLCSAPDGAGGVFIGGEFTSVGGQGRSRLAHILADGSLATWNPGADGSVRALAVSAGIVYAGGEFFRVNGQNRRFFAAIEATSGLVTPWNPGTDGAVSALAVSGGVVYVGGAFNYLGG